MMSQIGSAEWEPSSGSAAADRLERLEIFMSAILTYFGFIVTQTHALTKGSYRLDGLERSALNRPGRRALMVRGRTYRDLRPEAKAARGRKSGQIRFLPPLMRLFVI